MSVSYFKNVIVRIVFVLYIFIGKLIGTVQIDVDGVNHGDYIWGPGVFTIAVVIMNCFLVLIYTFFICFTW